MTTHVEPLAGRCSSSPDYLMGPPALIRNCVSVKERAPSSGCIRAKTSAKGLYQIQHMISCCKGTPAVHGADAKELPCCLRLARACVDVPQHGWLAHTTPTIRMTAYAGTSNFFHLTGT